MSATILVVDDHLGIAEAIAMVLQDESFTVRIARDGAEAFEVLETVAVDLVVSDVVMPVMDGVTPLTELCRREVVVPVGLMSVTAGPGVLDAGALEFLPKPFCVDGLLGVVQAGFKAFR